MHDAPQANDRIALAGTDVSVPPLGVGTWAWGDKGTWGMGGYDTVATARATIREAWQACIEAGVVLFDTAEIYGGGESERIIGRLLAADPSVRDQVVIATKFMPSPWKLAVTSSLVARPESLHRAHGHRRASTSTRSTVRSRCVPMRLWPRRWPRRTPTGWSRRSASRTTRRRRPVRSTPLCASAGCAWPATRSSSRSAHHAREGRSVRLPVASWASCPWPTRPSGRAA
jgi:hypothetical protein